MKCRPAQPIPNRDCASGGELRARRQPPIIARSAQTPAVPLQKYPLASMLACTGWVLCPDSIFRDRGGYEQTWSFTGTIQTAVETVLKQLVSSPGPLPQRNE